MTDPDVERLFAEMRRSDAHLQRELQALADGRAYWYVKPRRRRRPSRPSKAAVMRCIAAMGLERH